MGKVDIFDLLKTISFLNSDDSGRRCTGTIIGYLAECFQTFGAVCALFAFTVISDISGKFPVCHEFLSSLPPELTESVAPLPRNVEFYRPDTRGWYCNCSRFHYLLGTFQ